MDFIWKLINKNIYTFYFVPIILLHMIFFLMWLLISVFDSLDSLSLVILFSVMIVIPFLQVVCSGYVNKHSGYPMVKNWVMIMAATLLSYFLNYISPSIASQNFTIDSEGLLLLKWMFVISTTLVTVGVILKKIYLRDV